MEHEQSGDPSEEVQVHRPNRLNAVSHFLVTVGVFLLSFILFQSLGTLLALMIDGQEVGKYSDLDFMRNFDFSTDALRVMNFFGSALSMLATALITPRLIKADTFGYLSADRFGQWKWVGLSLLFFILLFPALENLLVWNQQWDLSTLSPALDEWNREMELTSNALYSKLFGSATALDLIINLILMAAIPAIAEELLFRGLILNSLHGLFRNIHVAIFVTALIFSLMHLQPLKIIPMTVLAMAMGYMVYWTGSIWPAVVAHAINNSFAVIGMYQAEGNYDEVLSGEPAYGTWMLILSLAFLLFTFIYMNRQSEPKLRSYYE